MPVPDRRPTRLVVFADVHGNLPALEAMLRDAHPFGPDAWLCLGDVAGMGAWPGECLERVAALPGSLVMGNADEDLLAPRPFTPRGFPDEERIHDLDEWSRRQLNAAQLAFVQTFQPRLELDLPGLRLLAFHGSPVDCRETIGAETPETRLCELRAQYGQQALWVGGHTHQALLRQLDGWTLLNPGSVGLAYERRAGIYVNVARADYLWLEASTAGLSLSFRQVPYDVQAVRRGILTAGMPHAVWWANEWVSA